MERTDVILRAKARFLPYVKRQEFKYEVGLLILSGLFGSLVFAGGRLAPAGTAIICAAWMSKNNPYYALSGALAGALLFGEYASASASLLYVGLSLLWKAWRGCLKKLDKLVLLIAAQLIALPMFFMHDLNECLLGLANLTVSTVMAAILQHGLIVVRQLRLRRMLSGEELFGLCTLMGLTVLALSRFAPFGISPGLVLAVVMLETAALVKGAVSVAVAVALGAALILGGKGELLTIANLSLCTLAAASARSFNRYGAAAGFCLCSILIHFYVGDGYSVGFVELAAGTLIFIMIPKRLTAALKSQVDNEAHRMAREINAVTRVRSLAGERLSEISDVFLEVSSLFTANGEKNSVQSGAIASVTRGVSDVMKQLSGKLRADCRYDEEAEARVLLALDREGIRAKSAVVVNEDGRQLVKLHLKDPGFTDAACSAAARALGCDLRVRKFAKEYTFLEEAYGYEVSYGASACPKDGFETSGDSIGIREPDGGRILLMLSDGMGSGDEAHSVSAAAVALLGDLVCIGFDIGIALDFVNRLLIERGTGDIYATMDAFLFDMKNASATFIKFGAPASYILRGGSIHTVYSEALPAGVLKEAQPAVQLVTLMHDDIVVLMTDGTADALGSDIHAAIIEKAGFARTEKEAADLLLDAARKNEVSDDMSVIVIKIL
ncbi:MAG: Stage II sporulation protein E [Firmicutes bacterium ADurb.Bin182]|nr:MAG: Stage II sporulation protein E [Firmicutes bacterium ADurb.Bin182]